MRLRLPFRRLRTWLALTYLFLIAASLGLLAWRIGSSLDASRYSETMRDQEGRAILAASAAGDWLSNFRDGKLSAAQLQDEAATLSREINQPITVLDAQGKILVDSQNPEEAGTDESNLADVQIGMTGRAGSIVRYDPDDKTDALFSVAPVRSGRDLVGIIRLELSMALIRDASLQFWLRIAGAALLAAVLTAVVSLWFAKTLTDPIAAITRAASALAGGDLKQRVIARGPEELQLLAHNFNFMADRVSAVMEDQRGFVANAAHELRTPLTTIRLRAEALAGGAKDDPAVANQFLTDITTETDRLARLVDELLDLSRIETGLIAPRREPISIAQTARAVADELAERAREANVTITIDRNANLSPVLADPDQMRQVFLNLLGNALKFTPSGGTIEVRVQVVRQTQASDRLGAGTWLRTTVQDSGAGIPAEDLPHIFDRFYRSDKARVRDLSSASSGGAGLGLAIAKGIVEHHGGQVWAESQVGTGTSVIFALPILGPATARTSPRGA